MDPFTPGNLTPAQRLILAALEREPTASPERLTGMTSIELEVVRTALRLLQQEQRHGEDDGGRARC
jgi:hypothetical protein